MQQTKSYWRLLVVGGVVSAFIASACVITTDDDAIDNTAGSGGQATGSGGKASGGSTATGGSGTAGSAQAGSGATAGTGNGSVPFQCDPLSEGGAPPVAEGTPLSCEPGTVHDCDWCVQSKCCEQYGACYATDPGNQCGWGGPLVYDGKPNVGELNCFTVCLQNAVAMSQIAPTPEDLGKCANECATAAPDAAMDCSPVVGQQTSDAVACQVEKCSPECFPTP